MVGSTKLTSVGSAHEAELAAGLLRQAGIRAKLTRNAGTPGAWLTSLGNQSGPVDIYVQADDAQEARKLLRSGDESPKARSGPSRHRTIQLVGRALLALALIALIAGVLSGYLT